MRTVRRYTRIAVVLGVLAISLTAYGLSTRIGLRHQWTQRFLRWTARALSLDVQIVGTPVPDHVLYIANHLSWLDILALGSVVDTGFVAKDDVAGWPLIGWLARIGGTIFINRESRREARGQADALGEALKLGRPVVLFPEGTTNDGIALFPFRPALFASVCPPPAGVVIQPIAIDYGAEAAAICWTGDEPLAPNARKILERKGRLLVTLRFLTPITDHPDRKTLAAQTQRMIADALDASGHRGLRL